MARKYNYALINKETLAFICSQIGVTTAYLASKTGLTEDKAALWLDINDATLPTINQAKDIAKALKIPFAGLYMKKGDVKIGHLPTMRNLRTVPFGMVVDDSALNVAIADLIRSRDFLFSTESELGVEDTPVSLPSISDNATPADAASIIRTFFGLNLSEQYRCSSSRQFYLYLRRKIEGKGIFISCFTDVEVDVARGVAISDGSAPIIGINAKDRPPAKSFSIIHELVHIIKRQSTLCNEMFPSFSAQQEEVFCNAVAGEVLTPATALDTVLKARVMTISSLGDIKNVADTFCVSREVIIRRLLDTGSFTRDEYDTYANEIRREFESEREAERMARKEGHGSTIFKNPPREAVDKNSSAICRILLLGYGEGYFSKQDISGLLGIKEKHIPDFIAEVAKW
jgi:Zn-dependent peptidase ImmA (M78 family)